MAKTADQRLLRFRWVSDQSTTVAELESVAEALRNAGADAEIEEAKGFFDLGISVLIVGAMAVVSLAGTILSFVKDIQHGGLIIDGTRNPPMIREDRSLDRGVVIFIPRQGDKIVLGDSHRGDSGEILEKLERSVLLEKLMSLL